MDLYRGPQSALTIAMNAGIYILIIMDRYGGPKYTLSIALHAGVYIAIIML
jgi:hypothetical protein